jgi:predicted phage tail protein
MSTATERIEPAQSVTGSWQAGVLGGVVGALAMGGLMLAMNEPTLAVAIPSLYALAPPPNVAAVEALDSTIHPSIASQSWA